MFEAARNPATRAGIFIGLAAAFLSSCGAPPPGPPLRPTIASSAPVIINVPQSAGRTHPVMLGIDVLEEMRFAPVQGRRLGLLTHRAGVNRAGVQTIDVLRRAPGVRLVALFSVEHGLYGDLPANQVIQDHTDTRTGLPVFSLYNGKSRKPLPNQLAGIDALVIDLQDIGSRSYTYISAMRLAMEACFENGKEVIVLDRPNPLGGLKVDGPPLDREWMSYVGAWRVPYVHGLTMGELAQIGKRVHGYLQVNDAVRDRGRLTVVPMKGWRRSMRWPETGLRFIPTSPYVQDFDATVGYAMTGLGCQLGGFTHGIGRAHPFRGIGFKGKKPEEIVQALNALNLPGIGFRVLTVQGPDGKPVQGAYVDVRDWNAWRPTELSFHLMRLSCVWSPPNPFLAATPAQAELFNKHTGSTAWWQAITNQGSRVNVGAYVGDWSQRAATFQQVSRKYWLYPP
jgi:uncharacterized protein YbbC (DUF1343 family)